MDDPVNWKKRFLLLFIVLALAAIPFSGRLTRCWMARAFAAEDLGRYEAVCEFGDVPELGDGSSVYRTGKVILVVPEVWMIYRTGTCYNTQVPEENSAKKVQRMANRRIDLDWYSLDPSVRASTPEEVSTVIICEYGTRVVGHYVSEGQEHVTATDAARRRFVNLKVYDLESGVFIGEHTVVGPQLEMEIDAFDSHMGDRPDIAGFVESMPVR